MAYRLRRKEAVPDGVQRIAREEIDRALGDIAARTLPVEVIVHESRKHCKKLRGLLQIVGPALGAFAEEDAWWRRASKELSDVRDADVLLATMDKLLARFRGEADQAALAPIHLALEEHRRVVAEKCGDVNVRLEQFASQMRHGRERIDDWRIDSDGFDAVAPGLKRTYRRGRKAMKRAYAEPSAENFHEWRKHAKYHWYHMRLLGGLWRQEMQVRRDAADVLSDLLGDDHDLAVLRSVLTKGDFGIDRDDSASHALLDFAERRGLELRRTAESLGRRLYVEKPSRLADRFRGYWATWRKKGRAPQHASVV